MPAVFTLLRKSIKWQRGLRSESPRFEPTRRFLPGWKLRRSKRRFTVKDAVRGCGRIARRQQCALWFARVCLAPHWSILTTSTSPCSSCKRARRQGVAPPPSWTIHNARSEPPEAGIVARQWLHGLMIFAVITRISFVPFTLRYSGVKIRLYINMLIIIYHFLLDRIKKKLVA